MTDPTEPARPITERYPTPILAPERTASPTREQRRAAADAHYAQMLIEQAARAARVSK